MVGIKTEARAIGDLDTISRTIEISDNFRLGLISRQALISLKMLAATPVYSKHTVDIKSLSPNKDEISEAVRFVLSIDNTNLRKDDLRVVLSDIGFNFDEIHSELAEKGERDD